MPDDSHFERANFLMGQSRYDLAEIELRKELVEDPNCTISHGCLAICLAEQGKYTEATEMAQQSIHLAPDQSFGFFALARVHIERERWKEAEQSLREAISIDPDDQDFYEWLALTLLNRDKAADALKAAEQGLEFDPEHHGCLNLRAMALRRLGRDDEAEASLHQAMEQNPNDSVTHANIGWSYLHADQQDKAIEHFHEALRLNPESSLAREGMLEVLRSGNFVYRWFLRAMYWTSKQSSAVQWTVFGAGFLVFMAAHRVAGTDPTLAMVLRPICWALMGFVYMMWVGEPLFDLLLRLSPEGRRVLTDHEIARSNWCAVFIVPGLVMITLAAVLMCVGRIGESWLFEAFALNLGVMAIPVQEVFGCQNQWVRQRMIWLTIALIGLGFLGMAAVYVGVLFADPIKSIANRIDRPLAMISMLGCVFADDVANWLRRQAPQA